MRTAVPEKLQAIVEEIDTHGWELNPPADMKAWSAPTAEGYTDFPFHPQT